MSENLPTLYVPNDLTKEEQEKLLAFIQNGKPNIVTATDEKVTRATELYIAGNSYHTISKRTGLKLSIILYLASVHRWPELKEEHIKTLSNALHEKTRLASVEAADLVAELILFWKTYYRGKIETYMRTKDDRVAESIDLKAFSVLFKSIEILSKFQTSADGKKDSPLMGLQVPNGAQIEKINDNTIKVSTPTSNSVEKDLKDVLQALADLNRARESDGKNVKQNDKKEKK